MDPALYIINPLVSEGNSGQSAVWETIHSTDKQYKVYSTYVDTLEVASIESVASVTGVGGHSVLTQW